MQKVMEILIGPLTSWMGAFPIFAGAYSLLVNTKVEEEKTTAIA